MRSGRWSAPELEGPRDPHHHQSDVCDAPTGQASPAHRRNLRHLRKKIDVPFGRAAIETVRGVGYRLDADGG